MQEWKASEKEAQKMTRDGAISVNLVTGEATHISDRPPEQDYSTADETAGTTGRVVDEVESHVERRQAKKARRKRRDTFREGEAARDRPSSRLQFTEEERAAPELKKAIRKSDKAADRLDAAKAAVPVKPPGREHGNPLARPVQEVRSALHGEVSKVEGENSGVQAGHLGERQIEKAVGYGHRRVQNWRADRRLKPWRDVKRAEQAAVKANADFYWQKSVMENPQLSSSNPISRLWQKKRLQKQYAAAHRAGTGAAQAAGKASQAAASAARKGGGDHRPEAGRLCHEEQAHAAGGGRPGAAAPAHPGPFAILHLHVWGRHLRPGGLLLSLGGRGPDRGRGRLLRDGGGAARVSGHLRGHPRL